MDSHHAGLAALNLETLWEKVFMVHPLVIIGSLDSNFDPNFAPKHMALPVGWGPFFGFVCTPSHSTYQNIRAKEEFTVTYPKPEHILETSLTATQRRGDDTKPELELLDRFPTSKIKGYFLDHGYLYLECNLVDIIDGFGKNSLILGKVIAARCDEDFLRNEAQDDNELIYQHPLLAYLSPGRLAVIRETQAFPFPSKFKK